MREILQAVFMPVNHALAAVPLAAARWITVAFLVLAGAIPLFLPRAYVYLGAPDARRWRDLRLWAAAAMVPYVLIYACL